MSFYQFSCLPIGMLILQMYTTLSGCYFGSGNSNSGPQTCMTSALPTESSPKPPQAVLLLSIIDVPVWKHVHEQVSNL